MELSTYLLEKAAEPFSPSVATEFNFTHFHITSISPLMDFPQITHLTLWHNEITSFRPLSTLTNLKQLFIGSSTPNFDQNFTFLQNLQNLEVFEASNLGISSLIQLAKYCKNIYKLILECNKIDVFAGLNPLKKCEKLTILSLKQNPICKKRDYRERVKLGLPRLLVLDGIALCVM